MGLWAPLPLLPSYLLPWAPLHLGNQSHLHCLPYCCSVLWVWGLAKGWDCRYHLQYSPNSISPICSSSPAFICMNTWNPPASWYVGKRHLCWAFRILLVVNLRGETSHFTMMLTSLYYNSLKTYISHVLDGRLALLSNELSEPVFYKIVSNRDWSFCYLFWVSKKSFYSLGWKKDRSVNKVVE